MNPYYKNDPKLGSIADFGIFKNAIETCKKKIHDAAIPVHDSRVLLEEKILGDDVARVRNGIFQKADLEEVEDVSQSTDGIREQSHSMQLSYSFVRNNANLLSSMDLEDSSNEENNGEQKKKQMQSYMGKIASAFNMKIKEPADDNNGEAGQWTSTREEEPIDEFCDMQELLVSAFPHVFILGKTYNRTSLLNPKEMRHLQL